MGSRRDWDRFAREEEVYVMKRWGQEEKEGRRNLPGVELFERNIMRGILKGKNMRT